MEGTHDMTDMATDTDRAITVPTPEYDEKGRPLPAYMEDRELLLELVATMRTVGDAVESLADSPMVKAMQNGTNPLAAMMGGGR